MYKLQPSPPHKVHPPPFWKSGRRFIPYPAERGMRSIFSKGFFKLMNNLVFEKTMEVVRKPRIIKLMTTNRRRSHLMAGPNYHTTKVFSKKLLAI